MSLSEFLAFKRFLFSHIIIINNINKITKYFKGVLRRKEKVL